MSRLKADGLLLICALIWGTTFVAQKDANALLNPLLFVGARFLLSAMMLAPAAWRESRQAEARLRANDIALAVAVGLALFAACAAQQIGLESTTSGNAGFLTALYVVLVPFVSWPLTRSPIRWPVLLACPLSLCGGWLLSGGSSLSAIGRGDLWVIGSAVLWALQISLVGRFMARHARPLLLSCLQYAVTAGLGLGLGLSQGGVLWSAIHSAMPQILYAGLVSGGIAFTLQIIAQRHTPAAEAALIMSLESVFAAAAGYVCLTERFSVMGFAGCALILLSVMVVELPAYWRNSV